jgi:hypothetical protein
MAEKKIVNSLIVLCASCLFVAPGVANVAGISSPPPQNREPAAAPTLTDGWKFVGQLGSFLNDRFALRDKSLKIDSFIDRSVFNEQPAFGGSATPQVLEGKDGYLFLKDAFDAACTGHGTPQSITENVKRFADIVQRSGRKIVISIAPDKSSVLVDKLPEKNVQAECHRLHQDQLWNSLGNAGIPGYVDLRSVLRTEVQKNRRPLYFRQDSHWNQEGSLVGVKQVVERFQSNLWDESAVVFAGVTPYTGDLEVMRGGTKTDETSNFGVNRGQIKVEASQQDENQSLGYRQISQMSGPLGSLVVGETLMMYDSFGMAAIGQIAPYFEKLKTVHFEDFHSDKWIEMIKSADSVLFMCVERGLGYRLTYDMGNSKFLDALDDALNGSK